MRGETRWDQASGHGQETIETRGPLEMRSDGERARITRRNGWSIELPPAAARVIFDALESAYCDDLDAIP